MISTAHICGKINVFTWKLKSDLKLILRKKAQRRFPTAERKSLSFTRKSF